MSSRKERETVTGEISELADKAAELPELKAKQKELHQIQKAYTSRHDAEAVLKRKTGELKSAKEERIAAESALDEAEQEHDALLKSWMKGSAADLAARLEDGAPCPVCGSTKHPKPAKRTQNAADEESVEDQAREVKRLKKILERKGRYRERGA